MSSSSGGGDAGQAGGAGVAGENRLHSWHRCARAVHQDVGEHCAVVGGGGEITVGEVGVVEQIKSVRPDLLFVAISSPKKEQFLGRYQAAHRI